MDIGDTSANDEKESTFDDLLNLLKVGNRLQRLQAVKAIAASKSSSTIDTIVDLLGDEDGLVQQAATEALVQIGKQAISKLVRAMESNDREVRMYATSALGEIGDKRATDAVIKALNDEEPFVRYEAIDALGIIADREALKPLVELVTDEDVYVRVRVAQALGSIKDKLSVTALIQMIETDTGIAMGIGAVKDIAFKSLRKIQR